MKIKLGTGVELDLDKAIESRMLVQANSGGGKSYTLRRFIEQTFGKKQIIIIDPEGEFGNMRSGYDFVYIAKEGGDAEANPRTAALLAKRLLETKANAIIDIYELGTDRHAFVKNFMEAMVNMPKELWTDCFVILDEAHKFAPEKGQGESIALSSVIDMASLGRKRGFALIPATQRPSKLSKDVVAECNNKLIGRASLDIDRKRSADELGFNTKEEVLSLRNLQPGEFYAFGPALSSEVVKTEIGAVSIPPPKRGTGRSVKIAPPSSKVKAILAELKDIPEAAEKEAKTVAELKAQLTTFKRHKCPAVPPAGASKEDIARAVKDAEKRKDTQYFAERDEWIKHMNTLFKLIAEIGKAGAEFQKTIGRKKILPPPAFISTPPTPRPVRDVPATTPRPDDDTDTPLGKGEILILKALGSYPQGISREHLTVLTTYKRSTRDRYLQYLQQKDMVRQQGNDMIITAVGIEALGSDYEPLPTGQDLVDHYLRTLPVGEVKILSALLEAENNELPRDTITDITGYQRSTRDRYIQYLQVRKLVESDKSGVRLSSFLV